MLRSANHCNNFPGAVRGVGRQEFWRSSLPLRETRAHVLRSHGFLAHPGCRRLHFHPKSNPIVNSCSGKFLISLAAVVLIFFIFIAALLYLLRLERADNLGAYSIPSGTGFLISSVYNS